MFRLIFLFMSKELQECIDSISHMSRSWNYLSTKLPLTKKEKLQTYISLNPGPFIIADLGCGTGNTIDEMVELYSRKTNKKFEGLGIDVSPKPLPEVLQVRPCANKAKRLAADIQQIPLRDSVCDLVYLQETLQYVPDTLGVLEEGYRVLKQGGIGFFFINTQSFATNPVRELLANSPFEFESYEETMVITCTKNKPFVFSYELQKVDAVTHLFTQEELQKDPFLKHIRVGTYVRNT